MILEYGNSVWGPFNRADQRLVERVQRRATRMIPSLRHLSYPDRLAALDLPSLYYRRRRGDMLKVFQLLHQGVDLDHTDFVALNPNTRTRGHPQKLVKPTAQNRVRRCVFGVRVVSDWNSLPEPVISSRTLSEFKASLDIHWTHLRHFIPENE